MPFMISPQEAQAIQEDEAQLVMALGQLGQRVALTIRNGHAKAQAEVDDSLRIQMCQRVVYGRVSDGTVRRELDANRIKVILNAIQRPVTPGVSLGLYQGKVPAIEIRQGKDLLFREERDGTVTTNQIQVQIEGKAAGPTVNALMPSADPIAVKAPPPDKTPTLSAEQAAQVVEMATSLINPYGDAKPLYDTVSIGDYRITQKGNHLTVRSGDRLILTAREEEVVSHQLQQSDWSAIQQLQSRVLYAQMARESETIPTRKGLPQEPVLEPKELPHGAEPNAIAVLNQQLATLPESPAKNLLQTTAQDWQQQTSSGLVTQIQNHRVANAVLDLFQRGHRRTGEAVYQVDDFTLHHNGHHRYGLHDSQGELMQFQQRRGFGLGRRVELVVVSERLSDFHRQTLLALKQNRSLIPQGRLEGEATYAAATRQVEHTVRRFLETHVQATVWDKAGGRFKLEMGADNFLRITDKQGRGVVFQRQNGEVFSRLTRGDFAHFARLQQRMQSLQQTPAQSQLELS